MVGDHQSGHSNYKEQDVRKGEQTRQEIIRKAAPIFNQKGALNKNLEEGAYYAAF